MSAIKNQVLFKRTRRSTTGTLPVIGRDLLIQWSDLNKEK